MKVARYFQLKKGYQVNLVGIKKKLTVRHRLWWNHYISRIEKHSDENWGRSGLSSKKNKNRTALAFQFWHEAGKAIEDKGWDPTPRAQRWYFHVTQILRDLGRTASIRPSWGNDCGVEILENVLPSTKNSMRKASSIPGKGSGCMWHVLRSSV